MSDNTPTSTPLEPIVGAAAFADESPSAIASRAAQYLAASSYAFGGAELARGIQDDADALAVPHVRQATPDVVELLDENTLDNLTGEALWHHGHRNWDGTYAPEGATALWRALDANHEPAALLGLLNYAQRSDHELEAVSAAGALTALTGSHSSRSADLMERALDSEDDLTRGVAAAMSGWPKVGEPVPAMPSVAKLIGPTSTPIHGTWGLVTDTGWHKPGSPLHDHLLSTVTPTLYNGNTYYMWSGEYSDQGRADGARDLTRWRDIVSDTEWLDTVYAHSHGGNVALNALADGQKIKLLVLMHTPAIQRPDDEWAAIRANTGGVIAMRTRMDLVVLGDSLLNFENRVTFDPQKLPHFPVVGHWARRATWFTHSHFTDVENWINTDLSDIVRTRYALIDWDEPAPSSSIGGVPR